MDDREVLVSIIVPVYKTEKYLDECMQSILRQDYPALEILLIDDGSPDNCPALCEGYAAARENVRVIHQENKGLGLSRNTGMDAARGKYIFFIDSDDCLDGEGAIRLLVEKAEEEGADITVGCYRRFNASGIRQVNRHHLHGGAYTRTVDFRFKGFYMYGHLVHNWGQLYRRDFLDRHGLRCRAYPFTQDKAHNMDCYVYHPQYAFIEDSIYLYRVNEESVTFRYKENLMPVWIAIAADFNAFMESRGIPEDYGDWTALHFFFGSFFLVKQELQFKEHGIREGVRVMRRYGEEPLVREAMAALAGGRYLREISAVSWRILIRGASFLFHIRAYFLFTAGIALLRRLRVDSRITESRNRSAGGTPGVDIDRDDAGCDANRDRTKCEPEKRGE